jgi:hypothetical protein
MHNDGSNWSVMDSGVSCNLTAVWGTSSTDVYAAGHYGTIIHYDGTAWSHMDIATAVTFHGLWGGSNDTVFAVGALGDCPNPYYCIGGSGGPAIFQYNRSQWSHMDLEYQVDVYPDGRYLGMFLKGIWGASWNNVYAVGFNAVEYCTVEIIHGAPELICYDSPYGVIFHYNGMKWSQLFIPDEENKGLLAIWGSAKKDLFVVGAGGVILHYNGCTWATMASGTRYGLSGVWGSSGSDVFSVGDGGTILHYDGDTWSPMGSMTTSQLSGVWGSSGSDVYAVGADGTILHYDGNPVSSTTTVLSTTTTTSPITTTILSTTTTIKTQCPTEEIYGKHSEETEMLRHFRDKVLSQTPEGQELTRLYYAWSPAIVNAMGEDEVFKQEIKTIIDSLIPIIEAIVE